MLPYYWMHFRLDRLGLYGLIVRLQGAATLHVGVLLPNPVLGWERFWETLLRLRDGKRKHLRLKMPLVCDA